MSGSFKKLVGRGLSFVLAAALLSAYGCGKKTVVFDDYPMQENNEENSVEEENSGAQVKISVSDNDLLTPEKDTFRETGKYEYNPMVIPNWILDEYENNPDIIRISKEALLAIDNHNTEFVIDKNKELSETDLTNIFNIVYFSNPASSMVNVTPTGKKNVFALSYCLGETEAEEEEVERTLEDFRAYVTDTINNELTSDMSEKEMAEIIYKKLVTEIDFEPVEGGYIAGTATDFVSDEIVKVPTNQKLTSGDDLVRLYLFFLTQLHIDTVRVATTNGFFTQEIKDILGDKTPTSYYWEWMILSLDGEYYNNDIVLEKIIFDEKYQGAEGAEPDMAYFAMSDDKRVKSYKVGKASIFSMNALDASTFGNNYDIPKCVKDYE